MGQGFGCGLGAAALPGLHPPAPRGVPSAGPGPRIPPEPLAAMVGTRRRDPRATCGTPMPLPDPFSPSILAAPRPVPLETHPGAEAWGILNSCSPFNPPLSGDRAGLVPGAGSSARHGGCWGGEGTPSPTVVPRPHTCPMADMGPRQGLGGTKMCSPGSSRCSPGPPALPRASFPGAGCGITMAGAFHGRDLGKPQEGLEVATGQVVQGAGAGKGAPSVQLGVSPLHGCPRHVSPCCGGVQGGDGLGVPRFGGGTREV